MNIVMWVLQILLALHTAMGAFWKFSNSVEQTMPSLKAIPQPVWIGMSILELVAAAALVLPALVKLPPSAIPLAAAFIAAEMLLFCILHLQSGDTSTAPLVYWLVVAALSGLLAYGRLTVPVA